MGKEVTVAYDTEKGEFYEMGEDQYPITFSPACAPHIQDDLKKIKAGPDFWFRVVALKYKRNDSELLTNSIKIIKGYKGSTRG